MNGLTSFFFELLQVADGTRPAMSRVLSDEEWADVCSIAYRQGMLGVAFHGLDRIPKEQCPSKRPMVKMYNEAEKIRRKNVKFNSTLPLVFEKFRKAGFPGVLIKGQGVSLLYPDPLMRTPGDIDIWLDGDRKYVEEFARRENPEAKTCYHHIDCAEVDGCEIEAHFTPSWMFNPIHNRRLQKWFRSRFESQASNVSTTLKVPVADLAFNRIFILLHIYRHLFDEGVGLRQIQDYYYVLKQGFTPDEQRETLKLLSSFGLLGFTAALMYVLQTVFNMDRKYLLLPPDEVKGKFFLSEILESGNFGIFDRRVSRTGNESEGRRFLRRMKRMFNFAGQYPSEVFCAPFFKLYNFYIRHSI